MTDYKHLKVLHVSSGKIVSIFQLTKDITWIGKERDKLIAIPADTPKEIKEIEMCFTQGFKRYEGTKKEQKILPFFKRKSGEPETLSEKRVGGEGESHKLAKNEIYTKLFNGELKINGKTINELGATDLDISEEYHSHSGHAIADVFIHFGEYPNHNIKYGTGIFIEIQFSDQTKETTKKRTLQRLREGWSGCWLNKNDFLDDKLKINNLKVSAREEQLKELREDEFEKFLKKLNSSGELIDKKIKDSGELFSQLTEKISKKKYKEFEEKTDITFDRLKEQWDSIISWEDTIKEQGIELDKKESCIFERVEEEKEEIEYLLNKKKEELNDILSVEIKEKLSKEIDFEKVVLLIRKNIDEKEIIKEIVNRHLKEGYVNVKCPFCNSFDCVAYPDKVQCFKCKKRWRNEETISAS